MSNFRVVEHLVRAQHTRDRIAGAELGRDNELRLHVKQYIPISNAKAAPGDITIIGAVADAFPKETLEPLWDDLHDAMAAKGKRIRAIWIADPVNQGESGVTNERLLGSDPSWFDHGRDLLFLINQFQDEMPHPIIGVGHSMGAGHLTHLSLLHPRLLHSLILMDPVFSPKTFSFTWPTLSALRRDLWPSRSIAAQKFHANPGFQSWDPRVLPLYIKHGLRPLPTEQYPDHPQDSDPSDPPVTLQTTKAQELYNYVRAAWPEERYLLPSSSSSSTHDPIWNDFWPEDLPCNEGRSAADIGPFSRFENKILYRRLPELQPSVLYILGRKSGVAGEELRRARLERTGVGAGGSGGVQRRRVREVLVDAGHLVPFEATGEAARVGAEWVVGEMGRWEDEERDRRRRWEALERRERVELSETWMEKVGAKEIVEKRRRKGEEKPPEKL